jgi:hypothetical protein
VEIEESVIPPSDKPGGIEDIEYVKCYDLRGEKVLFFYAYSPDYRVKFDVNNENRMPVKVYKMEGLHTAYAILEGISTGVLALVALDALIVTFLLVKQRKKIYHA